MLNKMKTNLPLQASIQFTNPSQRVWYAAHVLRSACTNSPAVLVRAGVPAVPAVPFRAARAAQTAKSARPATPAVTAAANTIGYAFGELYLNSPAYPIGTSIPAISPKPPSAQVLTAPEVLAVAATPAIPALTVPAVIAIEGYDDAITIVRNSNGLSVVAELPVAANVGIIGSALLSIGEITPATLQATAWLDDLATPLGSCGNPPQDSVGDLATDTLEQFFYKNALFCNPVITDIVRDVAGKKIRCKRVEVTLSKESSFDLLSDSIQLDKVFVI